MRSQQARKWSLNCHVPYINILTWLRGFHDKRPYLVVFLCTQVYFGNRPRSIYQYSNMAPRLSDQTSIFGVVFFASKSLLGIKGQGEIASLTRKPLSHARILIYRTWPIEGKKIKFLTRKPRSRVRILRYRAWPIVRQINPRTRTNSP